MNGGLRGFQEPLEHSSPSHHGEMGVGILFGVVSAFSMSSLGITMLSVSWMGISSLSGVGRQTKETKTRTEATTVNASKRLRLVQLTVMTAKSSSKMGVVDLINWLQLAVGRDGVYFYFHLMVQK